MSKGNLTLTFNHLEFAQEHIGKDLFLNPHTISNRPKIGI